MLMSIVVCRPVSTKGGLPGVWAVSISVMLPGAGLDRVTVKQTLSPSLHWAVMDVIEGGPLCARTLATNSTGIAIASNAAASFSVFKAFLHPVCRDWACLT